MRNRGGALNWWMLMALQVSWSGPAVGQESPEERILAQHGLGGLNSRIHPLSDLFMNAESTGVDLLRVFPHPNPMAAEALIGIGHGSSSIHRIDPLTGRLLSSTPTDAVLRGGTYVDAASLKPHYFAVGSSSGASIPESPDPARLVFYDPQTGNVSQRLLAPSGIHSSIECAFVMTTVGPGAPYYRWFWTSQGSGPSVLDALFCIDLRSTDILDGQGGAGPPFALPEDTGSPLWSGKLGNAHNFPGADGAVHRLAVWTDLEGIAGPAYRNYLFLAYSELAITSPPTWVSTFCALDADAGFPLPLVGVKRWRGGFAPVPQANELRVMGNYLVAVDGSNAPAGQGGATVRFWWIPSLVAGAPGIDVPARRGTLARPGATGLGTNLARTKLYIGGDESQVHCSVLTVRSSTLSGGMGLEADTGGALPFESMTELYAVTSDEATSPNPPIRAWLGRDWVAFEPALSRAPARRDGTDKAACSSSVTAAPGRLVEILMIAIAAMLSARGFARRSRHA